LGLLAFTLLPLLAHQPERDAFVAVTAGGWMALLKSSTSQPSVGDGGYFPVSTRASGMSISYNIAVTVLAGLRRSSVRLSAQPAATSHRAST
jgi:MHS family proline/betaine transporter-like MFS transporter